MRAGVGVGVAPALGTLDGVALMDTSQVGAVHLNSGGGGDAPTHREAVGGRYPTGGLASFVGVRPQHVGDMLPQEYPAGGLSVGGMLPRYPAVGPEGARTYDPVGSSSVGGMLPRYPTVGPEGARTYDPVGSSSVGGMLPRYPAVGPEGARTYDPVGSSSVGGMLPRYPAVGPEGARTYDPVGSSSVGGMLPRYPAGGPEGAQPMFDSVGSVDVGQRVSAVGGGVYVGEGCQPVPGKLAEKIWSWEYVEMAELLPEQWATKREDLVVPVGPPRRRRQVTDIDLWLQCFTSYVSVMSRRFPGDVVELLGYMNCVFKASRDFSGVAWVRYDATYRRQAAASGNRRWSAVNSSLYSGCFTNKVATTLQCDVCASVTHLAADCPLTQEDQEMSCSVKVVRSLVAAMAAGGSTQRSGGRSSTTNSEVCRLFNAGTCRYQHCKYRHECASCGGPHAELACTRSRPYPTTSGGRRN